MAKFLSGVGFGQASGSVAGSTYSHGSSGAILRLRKKVVMTDSSYRTIVRSRLASIAATWRTLSKDIQRHWSAEAVNYPLIDALGRPFVPSGFQFYCSCQMNLLEAGMSLSTQPPGLFAWGDLTISFGNVKIGTNAWNVGVGGDVPSGGRRLIYASAAMPPGQAFRTGVDFHLLSNNISGTVSNKFSLYSAQWPWPNSTYVGWQCFVKGKIVSARGAASPLFYGVVTFAA